jgi:hypothetical protein
MSLITFYPVVQWILPTEAGDPKGKDEPLFEEQSPPVPILQLQVWVVWSSVTGGDSTSKGQLTCWIYSSAFGEDSDKKAKLCAVSSGAATVYDDFDLFTGAAPSDGSAHIRIGNFNDDDGRKMGIYGDRFRLVVDNPGTAYTDGLIKIAPLGYTS